MSYILNALRKSERERQAFEPDTVTNRILIPQQPQHQRFTKLIAALIVSNLILLAYFLWFTQKTQPVAPPPADTQPAAPMVKSPAEPPVEAMAPKPEARPPEPKAPTIAEIVETRTMPAPQPPAKPVDAKKPLTGTVTPVAAPPRPIPPKAEPVRAAVTKPAPLLEKQIAPTIAAVQESAPPPSPARNDVPFLDELPAEFRRKVPKFPINVFVYSPVPAERFVMIDMVKYTPGQLIKDQMELREIRPDSLIVSYNSRVFKIKRP